MDPRTWNTYATDGHSNGGQDQRAKGGVRLWQVRRERIGGLTPYRYQRRTVASNGRHSEVLSVETIDPTLGERLVERARAKN